MDKITVKQEKFCNEYVKTGNATQSYINAGYKSNENVARVEASKLLAKPNIQARVQELMKELHDDSIADQQEILRYLTSVLRGKATELYVTQKGETIEKPPSISDRTKASELLGKRYGMWVDKVDLSGQVELGEDWYTVVDDTSDKQEQIKS